jgi:hypothetical protein
MEKYIKKNKNNNILHKIAFSCMDVEGKKMETFSTPFLGFLGVLRFFLFRGSGKIKFFDDCSEIMEILRIFEVKKMIIKINKKLINKLALKNIKIQKKNYLKKLKLIIIENCIKSHTQNLQSFVFCTLRTYFRTTIIFCTPFFENYWMNVWMQIFGWETEEDVGFSLEVPFK